MYKYQLQRDKQDLRDATYRAEVKHVELLPVRVDLRSKMPPVYDQGQLGSCTANAIVGLKEYDITSPLRLSRMFLYYHERLVEGNVGEDAGASIRDGMKVLNKIGVCPEKDWPYDVDRFTVKPTAKAEADAAPYRIAKYSSVPTLAMLKASLAASQPVVFGMNVYPGMESAAVAKSGKVPMPRRGEESLGGHAILAVGYDDIKKWVIVRNSWGEAWGDKGYFYLPYTYFTKGFVWDMWTGK